MSAGNTCMQILALSMQPVLTAAEGYRVCKHFCCGCLRGVHALSRGSCSSSRPPAAAGLPELWLHSSNTSLGRPACRVSHSTTRCATASVFTASPGLGCWA